MDAVGLEDLQYFDSQSITSKRITEIIDTYLERPYDLQASETTQRYKQLQSNLAVHNQTKIKTVSLPEDQTVFPVHSY